MSDADILQALATRIIDAGPRARLYDRYYDGEKRLAALGLALPPEMRQLQVVVNWPRLTVDALEERIDLTEFRMAGAEEPDDRLWGWWQANNLDEESGLGHLEAFVHGRSFITVGYDDERPDTPIITCESARNMVVDVDQRTRKVTTAVRLYDHAPDGHPRAATLYLPDRTLYFRQLNGRWVPNPDIDDVEHGLGQVPVVPMINRARLQDRGGRSEMADVMDLTDAACRALTDLQGAQELVALPARFVFGVDENDMKDQEGNPVPKWQAYIGRFNTISDHEAKVEQLPGADLRNFSEVINTYARLVSSVTGMPSHFLGLTSENPASADAIRSAEARHVKRAERKCRVFGGVWEEVMRLGMRTVDGEVPEEAERMEAVFADCATPTYAAKVDAVVKLYGAKDTSGRSLLPREAAWEELGWGKEKRKRYAALEDDDALSALVRSVSDDRETSGRVAPAPPAASESDTGAVDGLGRVTQ